MDFTPAHIGYIRYLLRVDRKRLDRKEAGLVKRFGDETDLTNVEACRDLNADLSDWVRTLR